MGFYTIVFVALAGLIAWLVVSRQQVSEPDRPRKWRFAPLAAAGFVSLATAVTFGAGVLLAPFAFMATIVAARHVSPPRGAAFWIGATVSTLLTFGFVGALAIFAYDVSVGSS